MSVEYYNNEEEIINDNNAPGTGKYFVNNITSTEIELKINQDWWGISERELSLETILIKLYSSMGEVYNAFKMGSLDLITTQSLNYEEYIGTMGYNIVEYIGREHDYLALNCDSNLLKNSEVRLAINYAIDKSNIIATAYENKYYIADFPLSNSNYLYKIEKVSSTFNTNKSREVLEENGWEFKYGGWIKTENYNTIRTYINFIVNDSNEGRIRTAEIIKKQLEDFGMTVNLMIVSDSQYNKYLENKNYDMILTGKLTGISPSLAGYISEGNLSNFNDDEIDELLYEASDLTDNLTEREVKYKKVIKLIDEERPFISLYFSRNTIIYNPELQGNINPNYFNIFYNIEDWVRKY